MCRGDRHKDDACASESGTGCGVGAGLWTGPTVREDPWTVSGTAWVPGTNWH